MLSFVLQNYYQISPFLTKVPRYYQLIKMGNTQLYKLLMFITLNYGYLLQFVYILPNHLNILYYNQIYKTFWLRFKYILPKKTYLSPSNLLKSYTYFTLRHLLSTKLANSPLKYQGLNICNVKPTQILNFSFHKTTYNTFIFYILQVLSLFYTQSDIEFSLKYNFIWVQHNIHLYSFLNNYYLKIRHF